ncbi:hypothetical protein SKAU_G00287960 [Synaphobranchus kaupii]|uniref:Transmembrane protein 265 n=1 Tax=Synaphobranchus kaupii TaxID=118154 RepID=A0A9Q1IPL8_SYNKA|nr:hypothetical protein SKAU_G00287960 [Synaphobranchus kaupii]
MSSPSSAAVLTAVEVTPLQSVPGSGLQTGSENDSPKPHYKDYRKLAISSIVCGISCIGIFALINSVKAREKSRKDPENAKSYSHKAKRLSLIAITVWVGVLVLIPMLMALVSYLLTLIN